MYQFAASQQIRTVKLAAIIQILKKKNKKKTVCNLKVNEVKVTQRNGFINNIFALESEEGSKK